MEESRHKILFHLNGARKLDFRSQYYVRKMLPLSIFVLNFVGEALMYGLLSAVYRFRSIQDLFEPNVFYEGIRIFSLIVFILMSIHLMKDYLKECLGNVKSIPNIIIWVVGGYIVIALLQFIIEPSVSYVFDIANRKQSILSQPLSQLFWLNFILATFLVPISEEFIFRYGIIGTNNKHVLIKIGISSLFFGLMHMSGGHPAYVIYYICMGLLLAFVYYKKNNNILYPISIHMLTNFIYCIMQI
ncbi:hypothetical protein AN644_01265 [Candidatus Epulonipiscium fishelsonii]|nr:hypothetical protein AN644_01265 [Epulopiscium sp. SCG-C06WGA-EpuloA1]